MKTIAQLVLSLFFTIFCPLMSVAQQTIGQPSILNFYHEDINAGSQNWAIKQDKYGTMYFANNTGLLTYNGKEWKMYRLPNKTIVRALYITEDMHIFVGGQDALGYFFPDEKGSLQYHSLTEKLPFQKRRFGDVWNIESLNNDIFFRTGATILKYSRTKNGFEILHAPDAAGWSFMGVCNGKLLAQAGVGALMELNNNDWQVFEAKNIFGKTVTSVQKLDNEDIVVFTLQHGAYKISKSVVTRFLLDKRLYESNILATIAMGNGKMAVGTIANGVFVIDASGKIIKNFSSDNGLQNNYILSLFMDKNAMLWMGLDEGIALVDYFSPIQKITGFSKTPIPSYASAIFNNQLYIGTADGVYTSTLTTGANEDISSSIADFKRVVNTGRQVWSLANLYGRLFMGHHNGAYSMSQGINMLQSTGTGTWLFRVIPGLQSIIAGTYEGIQLIKNEKGVLRFDKLLQNNVLEPLRFIEIDNKQHIVWASHPYRGIYKIKMNNDFSSIESTQLLNSKNGLPSDLNNFVFKANGQVVFTTEKGVYEYDYSQNQFKKSAKYEAIFGNTLIKFLVTDKQKKIWFATEKNCGVFDGNQIKYIPELEGKLIAGFENINPFNNNNVLISTYKGIIHLNYDLYQKRYSKITTLINKIETLGLNDSILNNGYFVGENNSVLAQQDKTKNVVLPASFNSFHFEFSSDRYGVEDKILYSYQLMGFDQGWSAWNGSKSKDYTNLPYGKYTFSIKSKDNFGNESDPVFYRFEILPRWYQTKYAYAFYFMFILIAIYAAIQLHRKRLEKQKTNFIAKQAHLKYVHELEIEHNEKEIMKLKNAHLESEMQYKNKELANTTMHLYKRGRLLGKIKDDLENAVKNISIKEDKSSFNKLLKLIALEEKDENSWEQFAIHFDEVHNRFLEKLKSTYPDLTPADLKLCAYLKMNLSSKEIAQYLHLSLKGVENGRYRLRKKLNLDSSINLSDFILSFQV